MGRVRSTALKSILSTCELRGLDPDILYRKSKMFLESYRELCWATLKNEDCFSMDSFAASEAQMRQALKYLTDISGNEDKIVFTQNMSRLFDSRWILELTDTSMIHVREFPFGGPLFFEILSKYYLVSVKYSEGEVLSNLNMERSRFYDRKKEAILIFGLTLWGTVIPKTLKMLETARDYPIDI